jgi:rubrerythrin
MIDDYQKRFMGFSPETQKNHKELDERLAYREEEHRQEFEKKVAQILDRTPLTQEELKQVQSKEMNIFEDPNVIIHSLYPDRLPSVLKHPFER